MLTSSDNETVRFGVFELDLRAGELRKNGSKIKLQEQPFQVLAALVEKPREVVLREELRQRLWPDDAFGDFDHSLSTAVNKIRQVLGDSASHPRFIETIPRRGYRFLAEVSPAARQDEASVPSAAARQSRSGARPAKYAAGAIGALALAALVWVLRPAVPPSTAPSEPLRAIPFTSDPGVEGGPTFSPNGDRIAFAWNGETPFNWDIYVKLIGPGPPLRLTTDLALDHSPVWSPDGRYLAFLRELPAKGEMGVFLIPALGGQERKLAETRGPQWLTLGTCLNWSPDGRWLAVCNSDEGQPLSLFLLSIGTGETRRLTSPPEQSTIGDVSPAFSPDGRTLTFVRYAAGVAGDLYLLDLDEDLIPMGEPRRRSFAESIATDPVFCPNGREIVFSSGPTVDGQSLWRVSVTGSGPPERLSIGERGFQPALSVQGHLAYTSPQVSSNIWRVNLTTTGSADGSTVNLIASSRVDQEARYSPDGKSISFISQRSGMPEVWKSDSDGSNAVQLTSLEANTTDPPRWAPDGSSMVFSSNPEGQYDIYTVGADGGAPRNLTNDPSYDTIPTWSRDGEWIYFTSNRESGEFRLFKIPAAGGSPVPVVGSQSAVARESVDGTVVYFQRRLDTGNGSLWSIPVEGGEESQVLESLYMGLCEVVEDGIYFVPASTEEAGYSLRFLRFSKGAIEPVFSFERPPGYGLSVSPDGRSILFTQPDALQSDIMLVKNFR